MISLETPQRKWPSSRLEGRTSWIFSSFGRCSRLTTVTAETRSGGISNGQSPLRVSRGHLGIPLPSLPGPKNMCSERAGTCVFLSRAAMVLGVLLESPQRSQSSSQVGACTCAFLPRCSCSVMLPFAWIKGSATFPRGFPTRLSLEAFLRGFPTRLSQRAVPRATVV